jgi:hypothetical protein
LHAPPPPQRHRLPLQRRRGAVEHKHRADAVAQQAHDAAEEAQQVRVLHHFAAVGVAHRLLRRAVSDGSYDAARARVRGDNYASHAP